MCGRFSQFASKEQLEERFAVQIVALPAKKYNIAPTDEAAVILWDQHPVQKLFRWGLIPSWATDSSIGNKLINARAETIHQKPAFRSAFRFRRCLVLSTGFFEWRKEGKGKQPYFIYLGDYEPFAFAGLWEQWSPTEDTPPFYTFTLITVPPNRFVAHYHDRMPKILEPDQEKLWINPETPVETLQQILSSPFPDNALRAHAVSRLVNNPRIDSPEIIKPVG